MYKKTESPSFHWRALLNQGIFQSRHHPSRRSIAQSGLARIEEFESRQLLTTITGTVFDDINGNQIRDPGEGPIPNAIVYIDEGLPGIIDPTNIPDGGATDEFKIANADGEYSFTTDLTGELHFRVFNERIPGFSDREVTVLNSDITDLNLSVARGTLTGTVFDDTILKNGIQEPGELNRGGVTVYVDTNLNNRFDSADVQFVTNPDGTYVLEQLKPGIISLRVVGTTAYSSPPIEVALKSGQTLAVNALPLTVQPGNITGTVFVDTDSNGQKNGPERGKSNVKVYLSPIIDGVVGNRGTPVTTDVNGKYTFSQVATGLYQISIDHPTGLTSAPLVTQVVAGETANEKNFALTPTFKLNPTPLTYTTGTPSIRVATNTAIPNIAPHVFGEGEEVLLTVKIVGRKQRDRLLLDPSKESQLQVEHGQYLRYKETVIGQLTRATRGVSVEISFDTRLFEDFGSKALAEIFNSLRFSTPRNRESNTAYVDAQLQIGADTLESTRKLKIVKFKK